MTDERRSFLDEKQRARLEPDARRTAEPLATVVDEILREIVGPMHRAVLDTASERDRAIKRCADFERTIAAMKTAAAFEREAAAHATLDAVNARVELATVRKALEAVECVHVKETKALREAAAVLWVAAGRAE